MSRGGQGVLGARRAVPDYLLLHALRSLRALVRVWLGVIGADLDRRESYRCDEVTPEEVQSRKLKVLKGPFR